MYEVRRRVPHLRVIEGGALHGRSLAADLRPSMPLWGWVGIGAGVLVVGGTVTYLLVRDKRRR